MIFITSQERREGRYQRRKQKRRANLEARNAAIGTVEDVFTFQSLYKAGHRCCNGVRWKASTQQFENKLFSDTARRRRALIEGTWKPSGNVHFTICERGKCRPIDAPKIDDRPIHKVLTQEVLLPLYQPSMIYNNGASLPGKGLKFSQEQLKKDLREHFRKYGREGCIILMDFKQFFPSASREVINERHKRYILDDRLRALADVIIDTLPGDIGVPLGVEPSQAEMVAYPSVLDNYITCQLHLGHTGHYMDDYAILVPPDRDAQEILRLVIAKAQELKLTISESKTRIQPLTKPFKFCKAKYTISETGKITVNGYRESMKRARRKIKAFPEKIENGEMTYEDLWASINGIMNYFENYDDHGRVLRLRRLFYEQFGFSCEKLENFRARDKQKEKETDNEVHCA